MKITGKIVDDIKTVCTAHYGRGNVYVRSYSSGENLLLKNEKEKWDGQQSQLGCCTIEEHRGYIALECIVGDKGEVYLLLDGAGEIAFSTSDPEGMKKIQKIIAKKVA